MHPGILNRIDVWAQLCMSSVSPRDLSSLVSGTASIVTIPASPTTDQDGSDEALYSPAGSMNRATGDIEHLLGIQLQTKTSPSNYRPG